MRCQEIMKTKVEFFGVADSAMEIARRMKEKKIGFAPVCGKDGRPIGTVTDRDIALRVCADDRKASKTHAGDIMTHEAVLVRDVDDVARAEELMAEHHKSRIMVVDDHGKLVGVISLSDLSLLEVESRYASTARRISEREVRA
jgi:CBS domain-containing protein